LSAAADRLKEFLGRIDEYITLKNASPTVFKADFAMAETFDLATLDTLTQDECFNYAFMLYQYADHIASERAGQENVARWCSTSLNSIYAQEFDSQVIAKHEIKVARVLLENELASKIYDWKEVADSRLAKLVNREQNIRRKADILIDKGRRK
jgi:hypothetical protein